MQVVELPLEELPLEQEVLRAPVQGPRVLQELSPLYQSTPLREVQQVHHPAQQEVHHERPRRLRPDTGTQPGLGSVLWVVEPTLERERESPRAVAFLDVSQHPRQPQHLQLGLPPVPGLLRPVAQLP